MRSEKVCVVQGDIITAYGKGMQACWEGLMSARPAIGPIDRFDARHFQTANAAVINGLRTDLDISLVMQMLEAVLFEAKAEIPADSMLFLATTTGEIDLLEKEILNRKEASEQGSLVELLKKTAGRLALNTPGIVVSSACASSNAAVAHAASMICSEEIDAALVVACDCVSEFVFSGFSSLLALAPDKAAPFDEDRKGLSLGEAAGYVLLMSEARAKKEARKVLGKITGWAMSTDANHMTGPSREAFGLRQAVQYALSMARVASSAVSLISAHGTGTQYNDAMEMQAFTRIFDGGPVPVYSIKGAIGHTLGAAGLIELLVAFKALEEKLAPPTVGLKRIADAARGWVHQETVKISGNTALSTSSGFGGVNAALVLESGS